MISRSIVEDVDRTHVSNITELNTYLIFYIITFGENALVNSFHGLFGIYELSELESIIFSLFVYVVIINAVNLR